MIPKQLMEFTAEQLTNEDAAVLLASRKGNITQTVMIGDTAEVIANLTVALTIALGSIKDPTERLQTKQSVSTAIMTKDIDLDALRKNWKGDTP